MAARARRQSARADRRPDRRTGARPCARPRARCTRARPRHHRGGQQGGEVVEHAGGCGGMRDAAQAEPRGRAGAPAHPGVFAQARAGQQQRAGVGEALGRRGGHPFHRQARRNRRDAGAQIPRRYAGTSPNPIRRSAPACSASARSRPSPAAWMPSGGAGRGIAAWHVIERGVGARHRPSVRPGEWGGKRRSMLEDRRAPTKQAKSHHERANRCTPMLRPAMRVRKSVAPHNSAAASPSNTVGGRCLKRHPRAGRTRRCRESPRR